MMNHFAVEQRQKTIGFFQRNIVNNCLHFVNKNVRIWRNVWFFLNFCLHYFCDCQCFVHTTKDCHSMLQKWEIQTIWMINYIILLLHSKPETISKTSETRLNWTICSWKLPFACQKNHFEFCYFCQTQTWLRCFARKTYAQFLGFIFGLICHSAIWIQFKIIFHQKLYAFSLW